MRTKNLLIVALAIVLTVYLTSQAHGHALPVRSDPAQNASLDKSPSQVTIWFSEPLNQLSSTIKVSDSNGVQVDNKNIVFSSDHLSMSVGLTNIGKGVYTVAWVSVSATDGHLASGSFPFGLQEVVPPPPSTQPSLQPSLVSLIPEIIVRWTVYLGQSILVGGSFFFFLILSPLMRKKTGTSSAPASTPIPQSTAINSNTVRRVLVTCLLGAAITAAGAIGLVLSQVNNGQGTSLQIFLFNTQLGQLGLARLILVGVSAAFVAFAMRASKPSLFLNMSLVTGLLLLSTTSLAGHNAAVPTLTPISIFADWVHLVGVSVWVGGLVHFASILPVLKKEGQLNNGLLRLVPRFSRVAVISVGIIVISGLYATIYQVGSFAALFGTEYGQTLLVKIGLTAALVIVGGANQLAWYPRITNALRQLGHAAPVVGKHSWRLSTSVKAQVAIALGLILVVGLLTSLPTGSQINQTQNRPTLQAAGFSQNVNGATIQLSIFPFRVGTNSFSVAATDFGGNQFTNVKNVILDFTYKDGSLPKETANVTKASPSGQYVLQGGFLGRAGHWDIQVSVVRGNAPDTITSFGINLPQYPGLDTARVWEIPYSDPNLNGYDTLVDGSGNVWLSAPTAGAASGSIERYNPGTGSFQVFAPTYPQASPGPIVMDSNERIWYADQFTASIGAFNTTSNKFLGPFALPYVNTSWNGGGLALDSNNTVWITDTNLGRVLAFNQTSQQWLTLNQSGAPTPYLHTSSADLNAITVDQAGNVWFVGDTVAPPNSPQSGHGGGGIGKIEMYNRTARTIKNFVPGSTANDKLNSTFLTDVQVAPDGTVWFAEHGTNRLGRISSPYTDNSSIVQISLDPLNPGAFPWGLKIDGQGNIWFTEHIGNKIGFYNVANNQFLEYPIPTSQSDSKFPALDQFGNVWFAEGNSPAGQSTNLGVLALQPSAIGLGTHNPDFYYELTVGAAMVTVAAVSLRWQRVVRFFSSRRRTSRGTETKAVKLQESKKKG